MADYDASTGEILPPEQSLGRAADGAVIPAAARTAGQFLDALNDGALTQELHSEMRDLAAEMQDIGNQTGQKTKGKIVITIDLTREDNAFKIAADFKVTKPKLPRPRSILWTDDKNDFTRFPPNQGQFFGVRSVPTGGGIRTVG